MLRWHCRTMVALLLVSVAGVRAADETQPAPALPQDGTYYIEAKPAFTFKTSRTEHWTVRNSGDGLMKAFAPSAPEVAGQSNLTTTFSMAEVQAITAHSITDRTVERRPMLELVIPTTAAQLRDGVTFNLDYSGTLNKLQLKVGKPPKPIAPLSKDDRRIFLLATPTLDYNNPAFTAVCKKGNLLRKRDEDITAFAARVYKATIEHGTYEAQPWVNDACRPSNTCKTLATDGHGFSLFFTAVMRANGIPARTLFGRWTQKNPPEALEQPFHALAEFYVPDTGWVPVDIASAVVAKPKDPMAWFGNTDGQFFTLHVDTDLEPSAGITRVWIKDLIPFWLGPNGFWRSRRANGTWRDRQEPYADSTAATENTK
ncbi:MAG: transglutaminase domain-containing protein [Phycisphaerae bacterium]